MDPPTLVGLALDALVSGARFAELLAVLDHVPGLATVRGPNGALLLHAVAGSNKWRTFKSDGQDGLSRRKIITAVFEANIDALDTSDDNGMLPIHHAAAQGTLLGTQFLLEQSDRIFGLGHPERPEAARDTAGMLPVHLALENGAPAEVVLALLNAGADADGSGDEKDGYGWELLHLACAFHASSRVVDWLLDEGRWESALAPLASFLDFHGDNCACRRCRGVQPMPRVVAADAALPEGHPAYGCVPHAHARLTGSLYALPLHIAARCGATRRVITAIARMCEHIPNCAYLLHGHVIDPYGYLPSDYAIARGAPADVVDALFEIEARVLPDDSSTYQRWNYARNGELDIERRRAFAANEPERRRRRQTEPGGSRSTKRPCVRARASRSPSPVWGGAATRRRLGVS